MASPNKQKQKVLAGIAHINATFNNTMVTLTDLQGNSLGQSSAGACGFKGHKKSTPFAAGVVVEKVSPKGVDRGLKTIIVRVSGAGPGRDSAVRTLGNFFKVLEIIDITPIPHNGCRPEKERRV